MDNIREAVEYFKEGKWFEVTMKEMGSVFEQIRPLVFLAERYLAVEGWPEKRCEEKKFHHICYGGTVVRLLDKWSDSQEIQCNQTNSTTSSGHCKKCDGKHKEETAEITEYCQKWCVPFNDAIDACKLAHLKDKERLLERLSVEKIANELYLWLPKSITPEYINELATALRKMIEEEK